MTNQSGCCPGQLESAAAIEAPDISSSSDSNLLFRLSICWSSHSWITSEWWGEENRHGSMCIYIYIYWLMINVSIYSLIDLLVWNTYYILYHTILYIIYSKTKWAWMDKASRHAGLTFITELWTVNCPMDVLFPRGNQWSLTCVFFYSYPLLDHNIDHYLTIYRWSSRWKCWCSIAYYPILSHNIPKNPERNDPP